LFDDLMFRIVQARQDYDVDTATEVVLAWLSERDPHGRHTDHIVRNLRAIVVPEVRVPEADYTLEERLVAKLAIGRPG
jgi:hypothetical protein